MTYQRLQENGKEIPVPEIVKKLPILRKQEGNMTFCNQGLTWMATSDERWPFPYHFFPTSWSKILPQFFIFFLSSMFFKILVAANTLYTRIKTLFYPLIHMVTNPKSLHYFLKFLLWSVHHPIACTSIKGVPGLRNEPGTVVQLPDMLPLSYALQNTHSSVPFIWSVLAIEL